MTTTAYKKITLLTQSVDTTWGDGLNNGPFTDFDTCLGGIVTKTLSNANVTLTAAESKCVILRLTGTLTAAVQITTATGGGFLMVQNATTGNFLVTLTNGAGAVALIAQGLSTTLHIDATNGCFLAGARTNTVGQVSSFVGTNVPGGWLETNGALVSRGSFSALWAYAQASGNIVSDSVWFSNSAHGCFSTGDGSTTFRLPDLRAVYTVGWAHDRSGMADTGRSCGVFQDQVVKAHTHNGTTQTDYPDHTHHQYGSYASNGSYGNGQSVQYPSGADWQTTGADTRHQHNFTTDGGSGLSAAMNVPQNVALIRCISYL